MADRRPGRPAAPGGGMPADVRGCELFRTGGLRGRLSWYAPLLRQTAHRHRRPHVSILVAGSFREETCGGERAVWPGQIGFRADDSRHAVRFGPAGALILSIEADPGTWPAVPREGVRWVAAPVRTARELVELTRKDAAAAAEEVADRLAGLCAAPAPSSAPAAAAPLWLADAAAHLMEAPAAVSIAALAREAGVHRVHFSREFVRHFGIAPSVLRRRAMTARAVAAALESGSALSGAAAQAGFADESHMARAVRDSCGMSPGSVRRLLARHATSVQFREHERR